MKKSFLFFVAIVPVFFVWANSDITNTEDITYNCSTRELRVNFQVGGHSSGAHNQYRYYDVGGGATVCLTSKPSVCRTFSCPNVCPATTELLNFTALATANNAGTIATVTSEGLGYTTAPLVTVTGGTCTKLPVATAVVKNKKVQSISLVGGKCTVAPLLTIAPPPVGTTVTGYIDGVINTIPPPPLKPTGDYWNTCGVLGDIYMTGYLSCARRQDTYTYSSALVKVTYDRSQCQTYGCTGTKASNALLCPAWKETEKKVFPYTSAHALQDLVIPADVSRIKVKLWGAGGGSETWTSYGIGGPGGYTEAVIPVTPGETLKVLVGQGGSSGCLNNIYVNPIGRSAYGFGGSDACDGGGGGLTGIFRTSASTINKNDRNTALSIAGGGGGSVTNNPIGTAHGGSGNDTVHAGGQPDMAGRDDIAPIVSTGSGGGGYAGGGLQTRGGNKGHSAGEGGSGFVIGTAYSQKIEFTPEFTIQTPPNTGDTDYVTNVGSGGKATSGGPGRAVVYFLKSANSFDNEGNFSAPVNYTKRDNINGCTDAIKCEWYCPTATPYYCAASNSCTTSANDCNDALSVEILDDENPATRDDIQTIDEGNTAKFFVRVKNNTTLFSYNAITLTDLEATACSRSLTETPNLIKAAKKLSGVTEQNGNGDEMLDPGEFFTYTCERGNVSFATNAKTFADDDNDILLSGKRGTIIVTSDDDTKVYSDFLVIEKLDNDSTANPTVYDNTQVVEEGGTAKFLIRVKNNSSGSTYNAMTISDLETNACSKDVSQTLTLLHAAKKIVNGVEQVSNLASNDVLDPGEFFTYTCEKTNVIFTVGSQTYPDGDNDITLTGKRGTVDITRTSSSTVTKSPVCTQTITPSELKAGVDQPYISCNGNGDTAKTHFRYRLTKTSGSAESPYILSQPTPITSPVLHSTLTEGVYTVECFYGTSSSVPVDATNAPHSCTKTITVKPQTDLVQGCNKLYAFKGNVLGAITDASSPYSATYRCSNRIADLAATGPFKLKINAVFNTLDYDNNLSMYPVEDLGDGRTSLTLGHQVPIGQTSIECSVKVGEGYSTNNTCQALARVGACTNIPMNGTLCAGSNIFVATATPAVYASVCTNPNPPACQYTCSAPNPYYCAINNACVANVAACIPLCTEGKYFCPQSNTCIDKGTNCGDNTDGGGGNKCNNNNVCDTLEGCGCSDCTGQQDHCVAGLTCQYGGDGAQQQSQCINENCTHTQAPNELRANVDQPYIACMGNGDVTKTHFRYKIVKIAGAAATDFISTTPTLVGTNILHPTLSEGSYRVECFYGTSSSVPVDATNAPHSCTKTMVVKPENDTNVQGCSKIYGYKGNTLSDEMTSSASSFDASFRCGSRLPITANNSQPYKLRVGSMAPTTLEYDQVMSTFFNGLQIGPVSVQSGLYTITNSRDIRCDVKVGNGYSTNNSCRIHACAGDATCTIPTTFVVVPSQELYCTSAPTTEYRIGCNPDSSDYNTCVSTIISKMGTGTAFNMAFRVGVSESTLPVTCTRSRPANALNDVVNCTVQLPTGQQVSIFTGDYTTTPSASSYQTINYIVSRDTTAPSAADPSYTIEGSPSSPIAPTTWLNQPVTVAMTCVNGGVSGDVEDSADACTCAPGVSTSQPFTTVSTNNSWHPGWVLSISADKKEDTITYTRVYETSENMTKWYIYDTAGNQTSKDVAALKIDMDKPTVTITGTTSVTLTASDAGSGLQNGVTASASSPVTGTTIKYIKGTNLTLSSLTCTATAQPINAVPATNNQITISLATNEQIVYCSSDNAGNVTKGIYPSEPIGCFSANNMSPVPTTTTYSNALISRLSASQYGYSFSDNLSEATCFRALLSSNISNLITSQYDPNTSGSLNWSEPAKLKGKQTRNTNGYYYFTNSIVAIPASASPITGQKTIVVEGGDVQIDADILVSSGSENALIIVARKINGVGGDIYIKPSVSRIDAVLIADGALKNGSTGNVVTESSQLATPLIINGKLYSFNTRGGSLQATTNSSTTQKLIDIEGNVGKYFDGGVLKTDGNLNKARSMDLERFRFAVNGATQCPLHINVRNFSPATLPSILQKPINFSAGTCGF